MFKTLKSVHKRYIIGIAALLFTTNNFPMEVKPGSHTPDPLEDAARHYVKMLKKCHKKNPTKFNEMYVSYMEAIQEKTPEEQLQTYIYMIEQAVKNQNEQLTTDICNELIGCYHNRLNKDKKIQQCSLEHIEEKVLPLESSLPSACFDNLRKNLFSHYFTSEKRNKKKEKVTRELFDAMNQSFLADEHDAMNQSCLVDENVLAELLVSYLDNWPQSKTLLLETLNNYSPTTQFNALSSCVEIALDHHNNEQAIELHEMIENIYTTYLVETEQGPSFQDAFEKLAQNHPELPSIKLDKNNYSRATAFDPKKYVVTHIKSPRRSHQPFPKSARKHSIAWQKPLTIVLTGQALAFNLRSGLLFAAHNDSDINCYDIKSGKWKKTLQYPGVTPLVFSHNNLTVQNEKLMSSAVHESTSLISSKQTPGPQCALFTTKKEGEMSYLLQGNENGTLVLHDLAGKKEHMFEDKHAAQITALLALPHVAYSGSKDRTIKKWNIKEKKQENCIEELEDTVRNIVSFRGNIITLMGTKKLVLCNLSEKPATTLTLFQLPIKEKNNALETITTFNNDELLIAGCKNGQLKIFTFDKGFASIANIDREIPITSPVKTLTNFDDEKLLVQYGDNTVMIFSKE